MKKILLIIFLFSPFNLFAVEKTKEEKVAKYVLENIQKDYTSCYSFYKIASESFKKANAAESIIEGLDKQNYHGEYYRCCWPCSCDIIRDNLVYVEKHIETLSDGDYEQKEPPHRRYVKFRHSGVR